VIKTDINLPVNPQYMLIQWDIQ